MEAQRDQNKSLIFAQLGARLGFGPGLSDFKAHAVLNLCTIFFYSRSQVNIHLKIDNIQPFCF